VFAGITEVEKIFGRVCVDHWALLVRDFVLRFLAI